MTKSLTIVLPAYNAESRLRKNVNELLELASDLTARFGVLIIDDGSTDATFEVAEELAAHFPQITVRRHRQRRGLGATLEYVQRTVRTDAVIVHDGVTPIDPQQMRSLWRRWIDQIAARERPATSAGDSAKEICDLAGLPSLHAAMERAHRQVIGFQLLTPGHAAGISSADMATGLCDAARMETASTPHFANRRMLGSIPPLPRPKFLSALAEFALGE